MLRWGASIVRPFCVLVEMIACAAADRLGMLKWSKFPGGARRWSRRDAPEESGQGRLKKAFPCGAFDE
jgi:hypothetical protein